MYCIFYTITNIESNVLFQMNTLILKVQLLYLPQQHRLQQPPQQHRLQQLQQQHRLQQPQQQQPSLQLHQQVSYDIDTFSTVKCFEKGHNNKEFLK